MKMNMNMTLKFGVLTALLLSGPVFAENKQDDGQSPPIELPLQELQIFSEVFGKIKSDYIDQADDASLLRSAVRGMLADLDPHSSFLHPKASKELRIFTEGKFGGLGIEVTTEDGFIKVIAPIDDTPAHQAGIQAGDIIMMLDGISLRDMSLGEAVEIMRGQPGSKIILTISRDGGEVLEVPLIRAIIKIASVKSEILEEGFGYLRITSFQSGTGASLRAGIEKLKRQNKRELNGLVLDLRDNPGGVLSGAVEVSDVFLGSGVIVSTRGRNATSNHSFSATSDDLTGDVPMVVLVNGGSASASEIVAGALQDHKRAIIIGTRTFGKGSVQTVIPLNNGGALKLTTARYYTPSDRSIQALGIVPDIIVEQHSPATLSERKLREADLVGHLENDRGGEIGTGEAGPDAAGEETKPSLAARDYQVGEALNLLKGMSLVKLRSRAKSASGEG